MKPSRWRARSSIVPKLVRQAFVPAAAHQLGAGMRQRSDRRQRVVQLVADHADHLLPGLHFLAAQFGGELAQQHQFVLAAVEAELAARQVVDCSSSSLPRRRRRTCRRRRAASPRAFPPARAASDRRNAGLPACGRWQQLARGEVGEHDVAIAAGATSSIATGVFCTIVSSSSSRCTSARRWSRSTSPSSLCERPVRPGRRGPARGCRSCIRRRDSWRRCRPARGTANSSARARVGSPTPPAARSPARTAAPTSFASSSHSSSNNGNAMEAASNGSTPEEQPAGDGAADRHLAAGMPKRSMRRYSAWRLRPSSAAACAITPLRAPSAASIAGAIRLRDRCLFQPSPPWAGRDPPLRYGRRWRAAPRAGRRCAVRARCRARHGAARRCGRCRRSACRRAGNSRPAAGCRPGARPAAAAPVRSR